MTFNPHPLIGFCDREKIDFTRGRPYRKNDQCHIEQKNGTVVRRLEHHALISGSNVVSNSDSLRTLVPPEIVGWNVLA